MAGQNQPEGRWVQVPRNRAPGRVPDPEGLWGMRRPSGYAFGKTGPAVRYQMPDGSLRLRSPNGEAPWQTMEQMPAWRPGTGTAAPYVSPFAGHRQANLNRIAADPRFAAPAVTTGPRAQAPALPPRAAASQAPAAARPAAPPAARLAAAPAQRPQAAPAAPQQVAAAQQNAVPVPAMTPMNWDPTSGGVDDGRAGFGASSRGMPLAGLGGAQPLAGGPNTEGLGADSRYEPDLATRRRAAFLGASDSMGGLKAVRSLLADEARAQGADISAGGAIPSIRFLENEIAKRQPTTREVPIAEVSENDRAALQAMQFPGNPITQVSQVSLPARAGSQEAIAGQMAPDQLKTAYGSKQPMVPGWNGGQQLPAGAVAQRFQRGRDMSSRPYEQADMQVAFGGPAQMPSEAPRAVVDAYMRDALANKVRQSMPPLNEVAPWQTGGINIAAPRTEPGRDAMLAAFAAQGEKHPSTPGEGLGMLMAGTAAGTRNGQSKPGNSYLLGHVDPKLLPPLGSSGLRISGGGFFQNPGNFYG